MLRPDIAVHLVVAYCRQRHLRSGYRPCNGATRSVNGILRVPPTPTLARYVRSCRQSDRMDDLHRALYEAKIELPQQILFPRPWTRRKLNPTADFDRPTRRVDPVDNNS